MAAQSVGKITRRLSSSTGGGVTNSPTALVFFTPPPLAVKFGKNTPESSPGASVFSPRDHPEVQFKSPRARLFKNVLRNEASTGFCDNAKNIPGIFTITDKCCHTSHSSRPGGADHTQADVRDVGSAFSPSAACKRQLCNQGQLSSGLRTQSSVSSPTSSTCSPTTLAKYSVQISKITLTPVKTFDSLIQRNDHDDHAEVDSTTSPDEDVVYFDTPFREKLVKKGLDGLDFKPRVLGRGGFGVVVSAFYGGKPVAVKMITKNNRRRRSIEISIQNEQNAFDLLRHPNLVQTFGIYELGQDHSVVVMEFAGSVHLFSILENPAEVITCQRRLNIVCQIADALRWCHLHDIVHLDVKPANVMVSDNDICKLGDFGCSRRLSEVTGGDDSHLLLGGTIAYRSPELLQGCSPTFKADIYSLGITMWQILSREPPYKGLDPHVIIYKVVSCDTRPNVPRTPKIDVDIDDTYVELYTQLWCRQQLKRPSIDQVVERLRSMR